MHTSANLERRQRFERVVTVLHPALYRYAAWLCRDPGIAEVVVQESLLRAWRSLDSLREDDAAKQWLLTIVRRENARYFERKNPNMVDIDDLSASETAMIAEAGEPDLEDVREAIYGLNVEYREPLVLQVLMGYSTREIAELMGIRQGAVLTRLHRARLKLKEIINADGCRAVLRDNG
jgi:RNA polymerase sigma-70 factor (ECF subfamily)